MTIDRLVPWVAVLGAVVAAAVSWGVNRAQVENLKEAVGKAQSAYAQGLDDLRQSLQTTESDLEDIQDRDREILHRRISKNSDRIEGVEKEFIRRMGQIDTNLAQMNGKLDRISERLDVPVR